MAYPEKVTYSEKYNLKPIIEPDGQFSAQDANQLKEKVNKNALFHDVHDDLTALQTKFPNPPVGAFAYLLDGSCYRCVNLGWTTKEGGGSGGGEYFKGYFIEGSGKTAIQKLREAYPQGSPGWRAILRVLGGNDQEALWDEDDQDWFAFTFQAQEPVSESPSTSPTELLSFTLGWQSGLTFQPNASWKEDGITKSDTREITLAAADATYDRFDLLAVDLPSGTIIAITGAPSENPAYPEIDPLTQLAGPFISVKAGSAAPEGIAGSPIYAENLGAPDEWNIGAVGSSFNTASTNSPYAGTKCIEVVTPLNYNQSLSFLPENPIPVEQAKEMTFRIKNITGGAFSILIIAQRTNGTTANFWRDAPANYDPANTADYQFCSVVLPSNSNLATISRIALVAKVEGLSYFLDEVRLVSGIDPVTSNYATEEFVLQAKQEAIAESNQYSDANRADLELQIDAVEEDVLNHENRIFALEAVSAPVSRNANFIIAAADYKKDNYCTAALIVTVPANATTPIPVGFESHYWQIGTGSVTFVGATGVTINFDTSELAEIAAQYNAVTLKKIATDVWILIGALKKAEV